MASSSSLRASSLRTLAPAPGWAHVVALAEEFRRAIAAAHRYGELKRMARAGDGPEVDVARRIFTEFYSD
jgi:hypothetical protein